MCGIVGYVGARPSQDILIAGLARLEYRGYDSAGIAVITDDGALEMRKRAGKLKVLRDDLAAHPLTAPEPLLQPCSGMQWAIQAVRQIQQFLK